MICRAICLTAGVQLILLDRYLPLRHVHAPVWTKFRVFRRKAHRGSKSAIKCTAQFSKLAAGSMWAGWQMTQRTVTLACESQYLLLEL